MQRKSIGDQELALLHFIGQHGEMSASEVAARFGEARGLARSTVLTMLERLRTKRFLRRRRTDGPYQYSTAGRKDAMQGAVGAFVERTLQGSVSPFVAWMSEHSDVSDTELAELTALVEKLQSKRKGE